MANPLKRWQVLRDARIAYVDWGENGPTILLLHGDMRTGRSWDAVARSLRAMFHVISVDARGHGDSEWSDHGYRFDERVKDLAAFCIALGLKNIVGVGHSTGGVVMALCAAQYPTIFKRLALLEPMIVVDEKFQSAMIKRSEFSRTTWKDREELFIFLKNHAGAGFWREDVIQDVVQHESYFRKDGLLDMKWSPNSFRETERDGDYVDLKPIFRDLNIPILLVRGSAEQNTFENLHYVPEDMPNVSRCTIRNTGHNMYMEKPESVAQLLIKFNDSQSIPTCL